MGKRKHYEPGTFCWVELQTTFDVVGTSRIAVVSDPQGAVFALFEGETDD